MAEYSRVISIDKSGIKISTDEGELFVDFRQCTQKFSQNIDSSSSTCVACRDVTMLKFSFYSSPKVSIYFKVKKKFGVFTIRNRQYKEFRQFKKKIEELGYTTYDLS